jgi:hypothetical protein
LSPLPPAEGERRAIAGYGGQYRLSAMLVYRALQDKTLQWLRVADPDAKRVDDLQIGSHLRVDAFQVKWSQYPGNFSFNDLITEADGKPCLVAQLAEGWSHLGQTYPNHRIVVHLITNERPSVADSPPVAQPPPTPHHFSAFLEQFWKPMRRDVLNSAFSPNTAWRPAWERLQQASRLSPESFQLFVQDCEVEFDYRPYPGELETTTSRDRQTTITDLERSVENLRCLYSIEVA